MHQIGGAEREISITRFYYIRVALSPPQPGAASPNNPKLESPRIFAAGESPGYKIALLKDARTRGKLEPRERGLILNWESAAAVLLFFMDRVSRLQSFVVFLLHSLIL